jgi:hypothetical protein
MRKIYKYIIILFVAAMIIGQFFRPQKNLGTVTPEHIFEQEKLPPEIKTMITNSCLDCHSNHTNYLWYHKIAPVSWMINNHIVEGKKKLNFSEWGKLNAFDKIGILGKICDEVEDGDMPIKPYTLMHKKARLSEEEKGVLCAWTEKLSEEVLARSSK